jgi:hypothetical protein
MSLTLSLIVINFSLKFHEAQGFDWVHHGSLQNGTRQSYTFIHTYVSF